MIILKRILFIVLILFKTLHLQSQNSAEDYINIIQSTTDKDKKFSALDSLIFSLKWDNDAKKYADFTDTYIDLALERKQYKDAIHAATFAFTAINNRLGQPERALKMLNRVEVYKDKTDDTEIVGTIYLKKGGAYFNGKDFTKAIENYTKATEIFTENDSIFKADAIFFRGQALFSSGNYVEAINDFNMAGQYYENLNDIQYMFYTQSNIISTYGANGFNEKTIAERTKLIEKKKAMSYFDGLAVDYYNQSINFGKLNNKEAQEKNLLLAADNISKDRNHHNIDGEYITIQSELASFYMGNNTLKKAKVYLDSAQVRIKKFEEKTQWHLVYNSARTKYLLLTQNYTEAEKLALSTLQDSKKRGRTSLVIKMNALLYKINTKKGNYKKALTYFEAKTRVQDSVYSREKTNAFSYYQTLYETERKEKEIAARDTNIKLLEQEKAIEESKTKSLIALLGFLVTITIGVVYFLRQRAHQLKQKIEFHKQELTIYTNELLQKSREHDILQDELITLKEEQVAEDKLDKLQDLVSSKILTVDDWKEFKLKFEKVYPNFLVKARLNNTLTNAEERLLTLEKLNLKTSEIADVLGVSSESVIKNRYRLRKKLGISKNIPITEIAEN